MFTKLGRKIILDSQKTQTIDYRVVDEEDDSFRRFDSKDDLQYMGGDHGHGHGHSHGEELTED